VTDSDTFHQVLRTELMLAPGADLSGIAYGRTETWDSVAHMQLVLALEEDPDLKAIRGYVDDSGEGRWTVVNAIDESVPAPAITLSLFARFASRQDESFAAKVNAALRNQFGGHAVKAAGEK